MFSRMPQIVDNMELSYISRCFFRVFKREKSTFKTEAEQAGFSWVLKNHGPFNESDVNSSLIHTDGPFWLAVRGADWSHVSDLEMHRL